MTANRSQLAFRSLSDPEEIQANEQGNVTPAQALRLSHSWQWVGCVIFMTTGILVLLGLVWLLAPETLSLVPTYVWVGGGMIVAIYVTGIGVRAWRMKAAINNPRILQVVGIVTPQRKLIIPGRRVWLAGGWHDLQPGTYRFYLLAEQNAVLSAAKRDEL